jgi:hypothetical protein
MNEASMVDASTFPIDTENVKHQRVSAKNKQTPKPPQNPHDKVARLPLDLYSAKKIKTDYFPTLRILRLTTSFGYVGEQIPSNLTLATNGDSRAVVEECRLISCKFCNERKRRR